MNTLILSLALFFGQGAVQETEVTPIVDEVNEYGAEGALSDTDYTIEEMLLYAIQDEYLAHDEYAYILEHFDVTKPFSNIIKAEESHISMLEPLFDTYGITLPTVDASEHLIVVDSLEETFRTGVIAEINNIAMYEAFLSQDLPDDIADTFTKLMEASESHLAAFEKQVAKY